MTDLLPLALRARAERDNNCVLAFGLALITLQPQQHRENQGSAGWVMSPWGG